MNNFQLRQIFLEIQSNLRCMHCGKPYRTENIHLRGSFKNIYLFQLVCDDHTALATITVVGQQRVSSLSRINVDDVLKFHHELDKFDGDFGKVFAGSAKSHHKKS